MAIKRRKAEDKKAPVKKAVAKKAPVKKAPVKKAPVKKEPVKSKVAPKQKSGAAPKPRQEVAVVDEHLPVYMKEVDDQAGNENVGMEDMQLPRLTILQKISDQCDPNHDAYVEGAEPGLIYNTLTGDMYDEILFCPAHFIRKWLVWKSSRGGLVAICDSAQDAEESRQSEDDEIYYTPTHVVLVVNDDGTFDDVTIPMAISKNKVSKAFNSRVKLNRVARFKRQYILSTVHEKNKRGESYFNFRIENAEGDDKYPSEEVFTAAFSMYEAIQSGDRTISDTSFMDPNAREDDGDEDIPPDDYHPANEGDGENFDEDIPF